MNTSELRNSVIAKINEIHDNDFLKEYPNLQSYTDDILKAEEDIKNGYLSSHDEVKTKMEEWKKR